MKPERILSAVALFALSTVPARAWTEATRRRMVDEAIKLTPPALNIILERYRPDLIHGMIDPIREESAEDHRQRQVGKYGRAAKSLSRQADQAVTIIGQPGRLRLAVYAMGGAAHFAADLNFPLNCGSGPVGDPVFYADYQAYVEKMMGRFPVVLDKKPTPELDKDRVEDFGRAAARRSAQYLPALQAAYTPEGRRSSPAAFDERSLPFGIASLSFSQAVNDVARVWTAIWRRSGGDLDGIPAKPAKRKQP